MLSFIKKMTSLIVTNFSQKLSDLKNFNFEVILRYYNLDLDNNLYFQNFHRKTKISTLESLRPHILSARFSCHRLCIVGEIDLTNLAHPSRMMQHHEYENLYKTSRRYSAASIYKYCVQQTFKKTAYVLISELDYLNISKPLDILILVNISKPGSQKLVLST